VARERGYVRPEVDLGAALAIEARRRAERSGDTGAKRRRFAPEACPPT